MNVFGDYAKFYDAIYQEKDYARECDFLESVFSRFCKKPVISILDLGCGTGGHTLPLAHRGYQITGIDRSQEMLTRAREKSEASPELKVPPHFQIANIVDLDLGCTFDAAISMFAVISYISTNEDLLKTFRSIRKHLKTGSLFIFDAWFGPAVLSEKPSDRYKIMQTGEDGRILRFVESSLDILSHTVKVHYRILRLEGDRVIDDLDEVHRMRYLFPQEVIHFLKEARFQVLTLCPFLSLDLPLSERDWNFTVVAEAS